MVLPCIVAYMMFLLSIMIDLRVPPCTAVNLTIPPYIVVGSMDLTYTMFEGNIVLESWGSQIYWKIFLFGEFSSD
jgi:hypothetical protein